MRPTILIVDDEVTNIEIMNAVLEDDYEICFATSGEEALEVARMSMPDLILLDVLMPEIDGYEVCRQLKGDPALVDIPVIFTTALGDQEAEAKGLQMGAIDYVTKPLVPIVVRARVRNHLDMKRMRDELATLAVTDALTGLGNRRRMENQLTREIATLSLRGDALSVIILDVDFFKRFNDIYGHTEGDRCLSMVAAALNRAMLRAGDLAVRYGGEEFACMLPGTSHAEAMETARSILHRIAALGIPHSASDAASYVTVSMGVATAICTPGARPQSWISAADRQLYAAKAAGRNTVNGAEYEPAALMSF
ncbi:diguanylate cyclase [Rhizobium sp. RCC_161_2]|uniref:diguanylate cyclase n=1 Tax=Rhizobium sp. RCC_161_2 TaxID=3239219 RepID=UPI0035256203